MTNDVGIDIIETVRIKAVLERHDDRFLRRVYTEWARAVRAVLKPLGAADGKEQRGRVLVVGGSTRYPGAVVLAARAAARCGAGVVTVASARSVVDSLAGSDPNLTFFALAEAQPGVVATASAAQLTPVIAEKVKALLVGPGLAHAPGTDEFVGALLRNTRGTPTVVDADGLNALARPGDRPKL